MTESNSSSQPPPPQKDKADNLVTALVKGMWVQCRACCATGETNEIEAITYFSAQDAELKGCIGRVVSAEHGHATGLHMHTDLDEQGCEGDTCTTCAISNRHLRALTPSEILTYLL